MAYPGSPGVIMNPPMPVCVPVEDGMSHGKMIMIQGTFPYGSDGMSVNLQTTYTTQEPRPDTGLHFNVRFKENCVVRNSLIRGGWGSEERQGGLPFSHGTPFELIILVENSGYKVAVNGKHFTHFAHRMQKEMCSFLRIDGNVSISFIRFQGGAFQNPAPPAGFPMPQPPGYYPAFQNRAPPAGFPMPPPPGLPAGGAPAGGAFGGGVTFTQSPAPMYNPPVPLTTQIPGKLSQGKMIFITGVPHPNPSRFTVNIQQGQYPNCDTAMHFDVRFNYGGANAVVVRNHRQGGNWGSEERHQGFFPFTPNSQFDMIILVERQCFKVAVNNQHFIEFHHRIRPINKFDTLDVSGDVRLTQVRFQ